MNIKNLSVLFNFKFYFNLLKQLFQNLNKFFLFHKIKCSNPTLKCEEDVQIKSPRNLELGNNVLIQKGTILHCGGMEWCNFKGKITLKDHVAIGPYCILYGAGEIFLGEYTHLGPGVKIISQSGRASSERLTAKVEFDLKPIIIGAGCWIGSGAIILEGTRLGNQCTVSPNSVVRGDFPDNSMLVGNPARTSIVSIKKNNKNSP